MDEIKDLKAENARLEKRVKHLEYLLDGAERKAERRRKHIERIEEACHDLRRRNSMLGDRLMPEGAEWPRYDSGEPVRIGDEYIDHEGLLRKAERIVFIGDGYYLVSRIGTYYLRRYGQRVKRPPVLAADGEPLEVGQTVWHVSNGIQFTVVGLPKSGEYQAVKLRLDDGAFTGLDPDQLTHQRPVLDADGVSIHEGDTVWLTGEPEYSWTVTYVSERHVGGYCNEDGSALDMHSKSLTHTQPEPPDSWERIEEDLGDEMAKQQCGPISPELACKLAGEYVRRCKALAEKGER